MTFEEDAIVIAHEPAATRASFVAMLLAIVSLVLPELRVVPWWTAGASGVAIALTAAITLRNARGRESEKTRIRADQAGVYAGEVMVLAREEIAYGFVEPGGPRTGGGAIAKLYDATHGLKLAVRVADHATGTALLQALGLDVAHRTAPFFAGSPVGGPRGAAISLGVASVVVPLLLGALAAFGRSRSIFVDDILVLMRLAIPALALVVWTALASVPVRVDVGADGIHSRWMRRRRFVPYASIARVVPAFGQLRVVLTTGESIRIRGRRRSFSLASAADHRAMVNRLSAAIDEHLARARAAEALSKLPPRSERVVEWMRELEAMEVSAETGYRRAVVTAEGLWRVVEDPSAEPASRVGAAIALRKVLDEHGHERLRLTTEASASPALRDALEAARAGEAAALEASIARLTRGA